MVTMTRTAFISGHVDLSPLEFKDHYWDAIDLAIKDNDDFLMGSARGADSYALDYLISKGVDSKKITVYLYEKDPDRVAELKSHYQKLKVNFQTGFSSFTSRDATMTQNSSYDIAWVRSEVECKIRYGINYKPRISGTQRNLESSK